MYPLIYYGFWLVDPVITENTNGYILIMVRTSKWNMFIFNFDQTLSRFYYIFHIFIRKKKKYLQQEKKNMSEGVGLFLNLVKSGVESNQEKAVEIYNHLMEEPVIFYQYLYEYCINSNDNITTHLALVYMTNIIRTKFDLFTDEQKSEVRASITNLCEKFDEKQIFNLSPLPLVTYFGTEKEWFTFLKYITELTPEKSLQLTTGIIQFTEKKMYRQPIVKNKDFLDFWPNHVQKFSGISPKLGLAAFLSNSIQAFPELVTEIIDFFPQFLDAAKESVSFDLTTYTYFWFVVGKLFGLLPADLPYYAQLVDIAFEILDKDDLCSFRKIPLIRMFSSSDGNIPFDKAIQCATHCNNILKENPGVLEDPPMEIHDFYCWLFDTYNITNVLEAFVPIIVNNQSINTENSTVASIFMIRTICLYAPLWIIDNWKIINDIIVYWSEKRSLAVLVGVFYILQDFPSFIGSSLIDIKTLISQIIDIIAANIHSDISFFGIKSLYHILSITEAPMFGTTLNIISIAPIISPDQLFLYLVCVAESIKLELNFQNEAVNQILELAVPLLSEEEDYDLLNGALTILCALIKCNEFIRDDLKETIFAAFDRFFDIDSFYHHIVAFEKMADLLNFYHDEVLEYANERKEILQQSCEVEDPFLQLLRNRSIIAYARLFGANYIDSCQESIAIAEKLLETGDESNITTACKVYESVFNSLSTECASTVYSQIINVVLENEDYQTILYVVNIMKTLIINCKNEETLIDIRSQTRQLFMNYIEGTFTILGGVPPESCDVNMEFLRAIFDLVNVSLNGPEDPEIPQILRFMMAMGKKNDYPYEAYSHATVWIYIKLILFDVLDPEITSRIVQLVLEKFTPDSHHVWYRSCIALTLALVYKKHFTKEMVLKKADLINEWFNYAYENPGEYFLLIYDFTMFMIACVLTYDMLDEFHDSLVKALNIIIPTRFCETSPLRVNEVFDFLMKIDDPMITVAGSLFVCRILNCSDFIRRHVSLSEDSEAKIRVWLKNNYTNNPDAKKIVDDFIEEERETRTITFSFLLE